MSQTYGIEVHGHSKHTQRREPVRYVVVIDAGGSSVAMLFLESRKLVAEFDAGAEEVSSMISGLEPIEGGLDPKWDAALGGHSEVDRRTAQVYALSI